MAATSLGDALAEIMKLVPEVAAAPRAVER
jgi:hypothetical protein